MIDPEFEIQRPFVVKPGYPAAYFESNQIKAFLGEYIVFEFEIEPGQIAELRMPFEAAFDNGLVRVTNEEMALEQHD